MAQLVGLVVAHIAAWVAFFALPPASIGAKNDAMTRVVGATAALVAGFVLPAGCWEAWRRTGNSMVAGVAFLITGAGLLVAVAWALQLG